MIGRSVMRGWDELRARGNKRRRQNIKRTAALDSVLLFGNARKRSSCPEEAEDRVHSSADRHSYFNAMEQGGRMLPNSLE